MKRILVVVGACILMASPAWAAQYCASTNARQEAALTWMVGNTNAGITTQNAQRANQTPPEPPLPLETNDSYIQARLKEIVRGYVQAHQAETVDNALKTDVEAADDVTKGKVRNVLTCGKAVC